MQLPFLNNRAKKREHAIAIDLGARTTKAVCLSRKADRLSLGNFALQQAPIYEKTISRDLLAEHLRNVVKDLGGRTKLVSIALGPADSLLRQIEMPMIPVEDMRVMLKLNPKNYLQQDLPDHLFDCYLLPMIDAKAEPGKAPPKCRVMVGGAKRQLIEDIQAAAKAAGLIVDQICPNVIAPPNALEMAQPEVFAKETIALVDLGFRQSTISVLHQGEIKLNRVVEYGGDKITQSLADAMNISYAEAEGYKVGNQQEAEAFLPTLIGPLGRELRASIDFFEHQQDKTVSQVFVSGGTASAETFLQALQTELMVACKSWNPTSFLELALPPQQMTEIEHVAPQLVIAIGTAVTVF